MGEINKMERVTREHADNGAASERGEMMVAKVPSGYEANINVRLVPGRDIDIAHIPRRCQSRKGGPRRDAEPLDLPPDLVEKLKDADKAVIAWLAQDEANARLFITRPVEALVKAGVNLTRADQKAIDRTHREVRQAAVIGPGVEVATFEATAFPRGQIGKIKPGAKPKDERNGGVGCAKED